MLQTIIARFSTLNIPALLTSAVGAALVIFLLQRLTNPLRHLPGPEISRWTNLLYDYYWLTGQIPYYVHSLHEKYGPIVRTSPGRVDICDAAAVKEIHKIHTKFLKPKFYRDLVPGNIHTMFTTTDPGFHASRRRLLASPISDSSLSHLEPQITSRVLYAIERITEEMESRGAADVFKWWLFMATDIIGELSFGESFRMLEAGTPTQYSKDLEKISSMQPIRTTFPGLVKLGAYIPIPPFSTSAAAGKRIGMYAYQSIQRYKNHLAANPANPTSTLFTKIFDVEKSGLSDADIRSEAQGYIVAGSDTTAVTLTYLVYSVCRDPRIRTRLVQELSALPEPVSDRDLRNAPYLNNVITETLRLYSAVPFGMPRAVPAEGAQFNGYFLPGGSTVSTQSYSLHRDPGIFPEPESFKPERWENTTKEMKDVSLPFGGGSRICIGMHLARVELRLATALFFPEIPRGAYLHQGRDE
ncbi:hypothetical protein N7532_001174 [Penicillium argentinense]|uniref:Cytochrome P450 n=1 Tax=Penicillium argentinense TaxID=1131581 RepID=A0A9W9KL04_9EURO|nr:uncharacterized protein N7532_001174 [Penicillium argentinense]KAJ5110639.1 hypothetical protein N7532_001174 [Penicillium argentinense]